LKYDRRSISLTVPNPAATVTGTLNLAADFVRVHGFSALTTGTDAATRVRLTDGLSRIFYLDAADRDYDTAQVNILIGPDVTDTGLFYAQTAASFADATGAAGTIAGGKAMWAKNPIEVALINGGTAGDVLDLSLDYSYGDTKYITVPTITVPDPAATVEQTVIMPNKYGTLLGFSALSTGTDVAIRIRIRDADDRVIFLDAADKDYDTEEVHVPVLVDDTLTGLSWTHVDATGTAATATSVAPDPIYRSPLRVAVVNGGTAGDTVAVKLWVDGR